MSSFDYNNNKIIVGFFTIILSVCVIYLTKYAVKYKSNIILFISILSAIGTIFLIYKMYTYKYNSIIIGLCVKIIPLIIIIVLELFIDKVKLTTFNWVGLLLVIFGTYLLI